MPIVRIEQQIGGKKFDAYGPYSDRSEGRFPDTINGKKVTIADFQFIGQQGPQPSKVEIHRPRWSEWTSNPVLLDPTLLCPRRIAIPVSYKNASEVEKALLLLKKHPSSYERFRANNLFKELFELAERQLGLAPRRVPWWEKVLTSAPLNTWE